MRRAAVEAAIERLHQAADASNDLRGNNMINRKDARDAWWRFLLAANGIYAKLEQGSKVSGKSSAWYGRKKHERKSDELLNWMHHARNSEEHSIDGSMEHSEPYVEFYGDKVRSYIDAEGKKRYVGEVGSPMNIRGVPPGIRLLEVRDDRYKDVFPPPTKHLGKPLPGDPRDCTVLVLLYLEAMIDEAEKLIED